MEWVETTGKTVAQAVDLALDQLGVAEDDAEVEVVSEPKAGLFGRVRGEARVRARVKPTQPRAKVEHRRPPKRRGAKGETAGESGAKTPSAPRAARSAPPEKAAGPAKVAGDRSRGRQGSKPRSQEQPEKGQDGMEDATVEDQARIIRGFLDGLLDAFDLDAEINEVRIDDETIELHIEGEELGLLVGPKGQTLQAIHELSRTIVQRTATGSHHGRVRLDVAGYRQRRREALARFALQLAEEVSTSGVAKALEPMNAADRKVIHDALTDVEGVTTLSEGEDPRRRVVIQPST